ncbi:MAG: hypothetical protein WC655_23725 [Candidatus Hydrogenedentales bacterium]|jgi:hypothetical protein
MTSSNRILLVVVMLVAVVFIATGAVGVYFILTQLDVGNGASDGEAPVDVALREATAAQLARKEAVATAMANLPPESQFPTGWTFTEAANLWADDDHHVISLIEPGWDPREQRFQSEQLALAARYLAGKPQLSDMERSLDPRTHSPAEIATAFAELLLTSKELTQLENAMRHRLYFREYNLNEDYYDNNANSDEGHEFVIGLIAHRAYCKVLRKDIDGALATCQALDAFASQITADPYVETQDTARTTEYKVASVIWLILDMGPLADSQRTLIADLFARRSDTTGLKVAIETDACLSMMRSGIGEIFATNPISRFAFGALTDMDLDNMPAFGERVVKLLASPPYEVREETAKLSEEANDDESFGTYEVDDYLGAYFALSRSAFASNVFPVALALKQFRAERGAYPERIDELVPAHIDEIPLDPMTGKPILYLRLGNGFHLMSQVDPEALPRNDEYYTWYEFDDDSERNILWSAAN